MPGSWPSKRRMLFLPGHHPETPSLAVSLMLLTGSDACSFHKVGAYPPSATSETRKTRHVARVCHSHQMPPIFEGQIGDYGAKATDYEWEAVFSISTLTAHVSPEAG